MFNNGFLLPFAPESPEFFLIPGDNQVTVLWRPSASETSGDPFFAVASSLLTPEGAPNILYDPNYRQLDVEGYRIYRGRVDSPNSLSLVAQFDYAGTFMNDFTGQINPTPADARRSSASVAPIRPSRLSGAVRLARSRASRPRWRTRCRCRARSSRSSSRRAGGAALATRSMSILLAVRQPAATDLQDTGVPFTFVDHGVRSNLRYFYSVVAFDMNSFQSGPSSIESSRSTKPIIPAAQATNLDEQRGQRRPRPWSDAALELDSSG